MTMLCASIALGLMLAPVAGPEANAKPSSAKKAPEKAKGPSQEEVDKMVRDALNGRGSAFDGCVARHMREYPEAKGKVSLAIEIGVKGTVTKAKAQTTLKGARNLRPCVEKAVAGTSFPKPQKTANLTLDIPVEKGAKFKLYGPKEKPPAGDKNELERSAIRFLPGNWSNVAPSDYSGK